MEEDKKIEEAKENEVKTEKPKANEMQYSGFWIRFVAMVIDAVFLGIIASILFGSGTAQVGDGAVSASFSFEGWRMIAPTLYYILFGGWISATPGKYICGIKIVSEDGQKLSWGKSVLRYIGYFPSFLVFCIGFIWVGFDKKKQGWHDKIAKTYVVKR